MWKVDSAQPPPPPHCGLNPSIFFKTPLILIQVAKFVNVVSTKKYGGNGKMKKRCEKKQKTIKRKIIYLKLPEEGRRLRKMGL